METQEGLNFESTISQETSADVAKDTGTATAPQEQTAEAKSEVEGGTSAKTAEGGTSAPFLTIQFNHEDKSLTEEEAITLAQKGMAYDAVYNPVARAAALKGMDVKSFIESFEKAEDDAYRAELEAKHGDDIDTINGLMELYQSKKNDKVKAAEAEANRQEQERKNTLESRLADEFIELQKEFPEVEQFGDLPKSVKSAAANGQNLLSEYLRFKHSEAKKAEAAKAAAEAAKQASTGNMSTVEGHISAMDALMSGLYR